MPRATQLELGLANETGVLAKLCRDLATGGVNLLAIAAPGGRERHADIVRLLVANRDLAVSALTRAGYSFSVDEVLFVELKNRPGALARAVEKIARAHIDIRYAYATAHSRAQKTAAVIAVPPEDLDRADRLLGR
jgi:hypothetical protein